MPKALVGEGSEFFAGRVDSASLSSHIWLPTDSSGSNLRYWPITLR